jgi:hypothetical protein
MMSLQRTTGKKIPVHWCKSSLESQWQFEGNKIQKANTQELPFFSWCLYTQDSQKQERKAWKVNFKKKP